MIFKNIQYNMLDSKMDIPIQLFTNKYDNIYEVFINKVNNKTKNLNDVICLGIVTRYNRRAGNLLGISLCFHFENETTLDNFKIEFEVLEGFNIKKEELSKYILFFENKLRQTNLDFTYFIRHKDER